MNDREVVKFDEFERVWATLEALGACDGWGGAECRRVWDEYLASGMPDEVADHIRRRANVLSDGSGPRTA